MTQPSVTGGVPTNPDGTPDYTGIGTAGTTGKQPPIDSTGAIDIWNLPTNLQGHVLWFDTGYSAATNAKTQQAQSRLARANPGDAVTVDKLGQQKSFKVNASAEEVMKQFAAMSQTDPMGFASLQKELQDAGFYGSATAVYGGWNSQTENAVAQAMVQYIKVSEGAAVPVSFLGFLKNTSAANLGINGNTPGAGGSGSSTPVLTDPDTLLRYAQMAAQSALGRNLTPDQLNKFIDTFHQQQVDSYTEATGHNGLSSMKDDPRSSAIQFVTQNNQPEFQQHQIQGYTDAFLNMFLPSGSSAPNANVDPTSVGY